MPNLEQKAVTGWFSELRSDDPLGWPPEIRPVETTGRASQQLTALGAALDQLNRIELTSLRDALLDDQLATELRSFMAQLGAARSLRLLHWFAEVELPDCNDVIRNVTQGNDAAAIALRATIEAVTREATVRRMFSPERITALELACSTVTETVL